MDPPSPTAGPSLSSSGQIVKGNRKGTRSCVECRHRKIRCVWTSPSDTVCAGCRTKGKECVPQQYRRTTGVPKLSSRDRINRLEAQIASLTASVRDPNQPKPRQSSATQYEDDDSEVATLEEEPDDHFSVEGPAASPPHHIRFLFDNAVVDPAESSNEEVATYLGEAKVSKRYLDQARLKLQRLMPSREWLMAVASYATPWMSLYMNIFPYTSPIDTKEELISQHEEMQSPTAHPVSMAMYLCTFAITAQQVPPEREDTSPPLNWRDAPNYAREVAHAVEATIISHTGLAITVEGIEMAIMLLRLQLGLGAIRSLWLSLRRTVALAELIGLPRVWHSRRDDMIPTTYTPGSSTSSCRDRITQKIAIWKAICLTDRLSSMMFNLPAATSSHRFLRTDIVTPEGEVSVTSHLFELSSLALEVQALDEEYILNESAAETYYNVLALDRRLRTLKSQTPTSWWNDWPQKAASASLVQFWHVYLTARVHLHAAMSPDEHDQYSYSRTACEQACETLSRLYPGLRNELPPGFFLCRIIDMQVFTAVAFLLLTSMRQSNATDPRKIDKAKTILETMDAVSNRTSHLEFINGASSTIRSLIALAQDDSSSSQSLTLRIPLLGKVRIGRKNASGSGNTAKLQMHQPQDHEAAMRQMQQAQAAEQSYSNQSAPSAIQMAEVNQQHNVMSNSNTLPWLMELDMNSSSLQDPFLADDITQFDQWLRMDSGMALDSV